MKVAVFLVNRMPPTEGGGFSYYDRLIHAIDQYAFDPGIEVCFVGRLSADQVRFNKPYYSVGPWWLYRLFTILQKLGLSFLSRLTRLDLNRANRVAHRRLKAAGIDMLFYPKQMYQEVDDFPFISMNWDIGHKSTYAFPEMMLQGNFEARERWYKSGLQKAFAVFVESAHGGRELSQYCALAIEKMHIIPLFPGKVVELTVDEALQHKSLEAFSLKPHRFFYYPAQYWAHKNHYNLLVAFKQLSNSPSCSDLKLVFTGADYGNKSYIQSVARKLGLDQRVVMLNFVSNEEVYTLYKKSLALVMPTFLGPTNMPLLEARLLGTPVICSDFEGHREMCGDGALYIDPASAASLADAMRYVLDAANRSALLDRAARATGTSRFTLASAVEALNDAFVKISAIRMTFGDYR